MAVARALAFLHKFPLIHRDMKPLNLLLTKTLEAIGDIDMSIHLCTVCMCVYVCIHMTCKRMSVSIYIRVPEVHRTIIGALICLSMVDFMVALGR